MNKLLFFVFVTIFSIDYLAVQLQLISRQFTMAPELFSALVMLIVIMRFTVGKTFALNPKYVILIGFLLVHMIIGIIINLVSAGTIIAGIRNYMKFLPFFLLPAVYNFSDAQIRNQLKLLLALVLLQSPLAIYQRFIQFADRMHTGDVVTGTVGTSSILTIILTCSVAVIMAFYLKKRLATTTFILLAAALIIPTTINETKSSLVFLPLALLSPIFFNSNSEFRARKALFAASFCAITIIGFLTIYDDLVKHRKEETLIEFVTAEDRVKGYLYKGVNTGEEFLHIGKIDSFVLPVQILAEDPIKLAVGLGIGNVSKSFLRGFSGEYAKQYGRFGVGMTAIGDLIWETGIVGVLLYLIFFYMIFSDSRYLSKRDGAEGPFCIGWSVVMVIMTISLFYKSIFVFNTVGYLFWFFSGYIAAMHYRIARKEIPEVATDAKPTRA